MTVPDCEQEGCRRLAIVGVGIPPRWVCEEHLNVELAQIGQRVLDLVDLQAEVAS